MDPNITVNNLGDVEALPTERSPLISSPRPPSSNSGSSLDDSSRDDRNVALSPIDEEAATQELPSEIVKGGRSSAEIIRIIVVLLIGTCETKLIDIEGLWDR